MYNIYHSPYIDTEQAWQNAYNAWKGVCGVNKDLDVANDCFVNACKYGNVRAYYWYSKFLRDCGRHEDADYYLNYTVSKGYPPGIIHHIRIQIDSDDILSLREGQLESLRRFGSLGYIYAEMLVTWYEIEKGTAAPEVAYKLVELKKKYDRRCRENGPVDWTVWS